MRFNKLYEKKLNPEQTAVSSGVQTLGTDQWKGTYEWSKDVAGHDGEKQHAPESPSGNDVYTDKPVVVGFSDADDKMTKAAMNGKVTQSVASGSKEPKNVNAKSPLSKNEDVSKGLPDHLKKHFDKDGNPIKGSWKDGKWTPNKDSEYQVKDVTPKGYGPTEDVEEAQNIYHLNRTGFARGPRDSERHDLDVNRTAPQEWALKINGKVWSKDGKTVTFNSKEQALKVRQSLLAKRPDLEVGLVTRGGTAEATDNRELWDRIKSKGVVPGIDRERYTDMSGEGLEGPFRMKNGQVLYYDPKEGKYYNRDTDMYVDYDDYRAMNEGVAEGSERVDTLVTKGLKLMRGPTWLDAVAAIKYQVGERDYRERKQFYDFFVKQLVDRYGKEGVAEGSLNDYFKRRKDEEDRIAGTKAPAKRTPKQTDYEKKRKEQGVAEAHGNSKIYDKCWSGYKKVPGKKRGEDGSCEKIGEASLATMRDFFAGDEEARDPYEITKQRVHFSKDKNTQSAMDKRFPSKEAYLNWLQQQKQKTKENTVDEDVIYRLDKENPMNDTEVLVIGGAGRYSLDGLRNKARKEVEQLAKDLAIDHGGAFRRSAHNVRQLQNTLNTIVAAYDELNQLRKLGGMRSKGIKDEDATVMREGVELMEKWTQKYKNSINCSDPKGFSQKAHCASKKK